jgi:hypothetical protein
MGSEESAWLNVGTLLHGLLFAYQKATKDLLGSGCEVFVQPTLDILAKIHDKDDLKLFRGKTLEEAVASFSKMLTNAKVVRGITFEKTGPEKYLLRIGGCAWAKHIHKELEPKDVTCPLALIVMAIYRKYSGQKVEETESKYLEEGTETEIRSFNPALVWRSAEQTVENT